MANSSNTVLRIDTALYQIREKYRGKRIGTCNCFLLIHMTLKIEARKEVRKGIVYFLVAENVGPREHMANFTCS